MPNSLGIEPDSEFVPKSSDTQLNAKPMELGMFPVKKLFVKEIIFNSLKSTNISGIVSVKLLSFKSKSSSKVKFPKLEGIAPVKLFPNKKIKFHN